MSEPGPAAFHRSGTVWRSLLSVTAFTLARPHWKGNAFVLPRTFSAVTGHGRCIFGVRCTRLGSRVRQAGHLDRGATALSHGRGVPVCTGCRLHDPSQGIRVTSRYAVWASALISAAIAG